MPNNYPFGSSARVALRFVFMRKVGTASRRFFRILHSSSLFWCVRLRRQIPPNFMHNGKSVPRCIITFIELFPFPHIHPDSSNLGIRMVMEWKICVVEGILSVGSASVVFFIGIVFSNVLGYPVVINLFEQICCAVRCEKAFELFLASYK